MKFFIGTYTAGSSRGIYLANLDEATGVVSDPELVAELDNPSFLTLHPTQPILYACSEIRRDGKREGARLVAYRIEDQGQLRLLGGQPTLGSGPCYASTDSSGRMALVAHYASGSAASLPIASDGTLSPVSQLNQHVGSGPRVDRQDGPHAHCIVTDPSNRYACTVDLGLDQVLIYPLSMTSGSIEPKPRSIFNTRPGSGPRHLTFHPDGHHAFLINELGNTLSALAWNAEQAIFTELNTVSTLPESFDGESITAEVLVHPTGKFVYGSNRGHDSLAVFEFEVGSQRLSCLQHISCGGKTPRNFRLDPSGQFLLAANQDSHSIVVFQIDSSNGRLSPTGQSIAIGHPSCIKFSPSFSA